MKIENLREGMVVKNYKELCTLLEEKVKSGGAKESQLKNFKRFFDWEKSGNKFIIKEIYSKPKEKEKIINFKNSAYGENLAKLLLYVLALDEESYNVITLPSTMLFKKLSMVNYNYSLGRRNQKTLGNLLEVDSDCVEDFYSLTHSSLKNNLETTLRQLRAKALIEWKPIIMVCKHDVELEFNGVKEVKIDEHNKPIYKIEEIYIEAMDSEIEIILASEMGVLHDMGMKDIGEVYTKGRIDEFYKRVNKAIAKETNVKYYFNGYKINYNFENIRRYLNENVDETYQELNLKVNEITKKRLNESAETRKLKAILERESGNVKYKKVVRMTKSYLENISKIIDTVIDKKANYLGDKLIK